MYQRCDTRVIYLYYIGEARRAVRQEIGVWVLLFFDVLYALTFLMGREFAKDYH